MSSIDMAKRVSGHTVRISDDVWEFLQDYAKSKALRRKGVSPFGMSFNDILDLYIKDKEGSD